MGASRIYSDFTKINLSLITITIGVRGELLTLRAPLLNYLYAINQTTTKKQQQQPQKLLQTTTTAATTSNNNNNNNNNNNEFFIIYSFSICRLNGCESYYRKKGTKSILKAQFVVQDQTIILKLIRNLM